jgi:hypothetical protein
MKQIILAIMATLLCAAPAAAQYGPYGGYGGGYGRDYDDDDDDFRPRRYGRPRYEERYGRPYGPPPGYGRQRRADFGSVCVTSRGSCPVGRPQPHNAPCGCNIPGFGYKRGAVAGRATFGY